MKAEYETIIIFDERVSDREYSTLGDSYAKYLTDTLDCSLRGVDRLGRKKLAYPITAEDKYKCIEGMYILFTYISTPENIPHIENTLRKDPTVIKFLTVKTDREEDEDIDDIEKIIDSPFLEESEQSIPDVNIDIIDAWDKIFC